MGVRVFLPEAPAAPEPVEAPEAPEAQIEQAVPAPVRAERPVAPLPAAVIPIAARATGVDGMDWDALERTVSACTACKLCRGRTQTVFGVGDRQADWLVVGEAPGENEDLQGEPFVGQAGKLLDNMLRSLGVARGRGVYIANVLKCRPPGNRNPEPDEVAQCEPFLRRQVALIQPRIILAMGRFAVQSLLQSSDPIGRLRGRLHQYNGVPLVVTYHPAYLLRNLPDKAKAWADLCLARSVLQG
ncbi:uracil-DNA glycosylase [Ramlibacter sp.]|uniref:uracil-DNA glycosylase n=1 Tax=Ramlibacter sp. TaxID=1917967 RepID=UPI0039C8D056